MEQFIPFAVRNWYLFAALLIILGLLIGSELLPRLRGIVKVNPLQALQLINHQDALVLDIREANEYKAGHISEARHLPLSKLNERLNELQKFKNRPIIVCCQTGARSSGACALLKKNGFATVHNLSGGLPAWQNANLPLTRK